MPHRAVVLVLAMVVAVVAGSAAQAREPTQVPLAKVFLPLTARDAPNALTNILVSEVSGSEVLVTVDYRYSGEGEGTAAIGAMPYPAGGTPAGFGHSPRA